MIGSIPLLSMVIILCVYFRLLNIWALPEKGFYEVLYPGHSKVLKWTKKDLQEIISSGFGSEWYVNRSDSYFIHVGSSWIYFKSKKDLLNILSDRRKEIQRFIKKNKLNYKKDRDNTVTQVAGYYDQIAF